MIYFLLLQLGLSVFFSFSFREFDENLLRKVFELFYENGLLDLPYAPDVGDYLVCEVLIIWIT
jgi:hypothetical protein